MVRANSEELHAAVHCLQQLAELFRQRRQQLAASVGLTEQQWAVLEETSSEHFLPSLFARTRESTPAAVSKILRQLMDKKLIEVSLDEVDGRQRRYSPSALGRTTLKELRSRRQQAIEAVWGDFDATDVSQFTQFGNALTERLSEYAENKPLKRRTPPHAS